MADANTKDLADVAELKEYLQGTPFASSGIDILTGGTGNFACRLHLISPYQGQSTLVLKHAKPYIFTARNWPFSLERQKFEVEALKIVGASIPDNDFVNVPEVHLFDEKESIIIMEDCGVGSLTLKQFAMDGKCTLDTAEKIGLELGLFLRRIHAINRERNSAVCDVFEGNAEAKRISAWATYGRLVSTLSGEDALPALQNSPLDIKEGDMKAIEEIAKTMSALMISAKDTFIMGDFWPGNVLVSCDSDNSVKGISIVDWELSKTGWPALDLGQFTAEVSLLRRFHPSFEAEGAKMISALYSSYAIDEEEARMAVLHWGVHLIVWTPRVQWGGTEETKEMVLKGVELVASPTEVYLPPSFPYPIKISSIDASVSANVERGTRLLSYSFVYLGHAPGSLPETRFGTWDSAIDGTLQVWHISVGDVISQRKAKEKPVAVIVEPCKHGMQLQGLCVLCGKDMTNIDYIGFSDASRASIQMTHSAFGPTVSFEEAQRIERETANRLLKNRKLSLIVDLDQTIVHATVDPTVGEWMAEGEAWEAAKGSGEDESDPKECNPNWDALKDVKKFRLGPETLGSLSRGKGKSPANKGVENEGCIYYIKPRPGWSEFLSQMAKMYEMHVYTMGTRAYAEEVCAAIDPSGEAFGGRILSRDESGSLTQKSLQRLFPCDTSMVVIIDDRADVWEWSPNLLKVIPFDFFVGIGDINSTFLPKVAPLTPPSTPHTASKPEPPVTPENDPTPEELERSEAEQKEMLSKNSETLNAQVQERPLAKMQEELKQSISAEDSSTIEPIAAPQNSDEEEAQPEEEKTSDSDAPIKESLKQGKMPQKALLKNDDIELFRLDHILGEIHHKFYEAYDARPAQSSKQPSKAKTKPEKPLYDVTRIIPGIRADVLKDVHILFSSVIPLDTRPESAEIWRLAVMFGAKCSTELTPETTHVVAAKRGTVKVDMARRRGNIKIVWPTWLTDSIALWQKRPEVTYLLDEPPVAEQSTTPPQASSDLDIDDDEWDLESAPTSGGVSLGVNPGSAFHADEINWNDINDEVEAAMMESDDEEDTEDVKSVKSDRSIRSGNVSEDECTPKGGKRKRLRSLTPSEIPGMNRDSDVLRSPLSKRKKLAADRLGLSKLKVAIHADDLRSSRSRDRSASPTGKLTGSSPGNEDSDMEEVAGIKGDQEEDDEGDESGTEDIEDDFLARELENEWG
ncbi:hypothetical protein BDP27DRAFT_1381023 [Rhodocollybia butyracea]|uniref:protein-serine/threonine phosphatase n=1 Tax=Rhodocollybia butyracea TaxID=206335 RepID=A0A9P5UCB2_9AGAR|nr:hypothetical protein BDP27DRAFT_1381023 [Rhodocollybia butyracea]